MSASGEGGARRIDDGVRRDAELAEERLVVRRGTEVLDRDGAAAGSEIAVPAERESSLDRDAGGDGAGDAGGTMTRGEAAAAADEGEGESREGELVPDSET